MKKLVIILVAVFALTKINAQDTQIYTLKRSLMPKVGLVTGGGLSWLSYGFEETNPQFSYRFGAALNIPISRHASLEFESLFSKKGGQINYLTNALYVGKVNYNLYYLDLPILVKLKVSPVISFVAGFQPGYLLDANVEYIDPYVYGYAEINENSLSQWNSSVIGGLSFGGRRRALDFRFAYGLNSVANTDYSNSFLEDTQNMSFQVCFTRYFGGR